MGSVCVKERTDQITCPDCGLILHVDPTASGNTFVFDMNEWQARGHGLRMESARGMRARELMDFVR